MVPSIFYAPTSDGLIKKPNSWTKVRWMALISLLELKSADIGTDFFQKVMGYWMHRTCVRFPGYLSPSLFSLSSSALIASTASFLVAVTGMKIVKNDTSFFTLFLSSEDTC